MIYKVRVKHGYAISGFAKDKARLQVMAGEYEVEPAAIIYDAAVGGERVLYFRGADQRDGGDLAVKITDYVFLESFPKLLNDVPIEVI